MWGTDRAVAIARTIRALEEMVVEGVATTIPADLAILRHPDFHAVDPLDQVGRGDASTCQRRRRRRRRADAGTTRRALVERRTTVEVNGKRFAVKLWVPESAARPRRRRGGPGAQEAGAAERPRRGAAAAAAR